MVLFVAVINKYRYYLNLYRKQKKVFDNAFIQTYALYVKTSDDNENVAATNYTQKEIDSIRKMMQTMPESGYVSTAAQIESK